MLRLSEGGLWLVDLRAHVLHASRGRRGRWRAGTGTSDRLDEVGVTTVGVGLRLRGDWRRDIAMGHARRVCLLGGGKTHFALVRLGLRGHVLGWARRIVARDGSLAGQELLQDLGDPRVVRRRVLPRQHLGGLVELLRQADQRHGVVLRGPLRVPGLRPVEDATGKRQRGSGKV